MYKLLEVFLKKETKAFRSISYSATDPEDFEIGYDLKMRVKERKNSILILSSVISNIWKNPQAWRIRKGNEYSSCHFLMDLCSCAYGSG